jgi:hypothetical protein
MSLEYIKDEKHVYIQNTCTIKMTGTYCCPSRNDGDGFRPLNACSTEFAKVMYYLPRGLLYHASPVIMVTSQREKGLRGQPLGHSNTGQSQQC